MNAVQAAAAYQTVVLEGCDGAGKTTLAAHLTQAHGFTVVHSIRTPDHLDLAGRYRDLLQQPVRLVLDRCFISELVYGPLRRGRSRLTWVQAFDLAEAVAARNGVFLHLTAPPAVIHARLIQRDGTAEDLAEVTALVAAYHRAFETLSSYAPVLTIDTTVEELPSTG
jgi:thymidylate kinase